MKLVSTQVLAWELSSTAPATRLSAWPCGVEVDPERQRHLTSWWSLGMATSCWQDQIPGMVKCNWTWRDVEQRMKSGKDHYQITGSKANLNPLPIFKAQPCVTTLLQRLKSKYLNRLCEELQMTKRTKELAGCCIGMEVVMCSGCLVSWTQCSVVIYLNDYHACHNPTTTPTRVEWVFEGFHEKERSVLSSCEMI